MALDLEGSFRRFFFDEFYIVKIALGNSPLAFTSWKITQDSAPLALCLEILFGKLSFGRFHIEKVSWASLLWQVPYWEGFFAHFSFGGFYIKKASLGNYPFVGSILRRCPFGQFSFARFPHKSYFFGTFSSCNSILELFGSFLHSTIALSNSRLVIKFNI